MNKTMIPALIALCGFSCTGPMSSDATTITEEMDFGARNAPWEGDPCRDYEASGHEGAALKVPCSHNDSWSLTDKNNDSQYFGASLTPTSFGKVNLWAYYWSECGTCIQQLGYLQAVKDTLAREGYDVEIVGVAYDGNAVGTLGSSPRDANGACRGRASLPSCVDENTIRLDIPVVGGGGPVANMHDVERGDWFIYRPDGRLFEFIRSEEREPRNGFLGDGPNWDFIIQRLKAAVMVPTADEQPCADDYGCTVIGQWCQFDEGQCGGRGRCVTSLMPENTNYSTGYIEQVCDGTVSRVPVCTCNGLTYASRCDAELDEMNISHIGACE